MLRNIGFLLLGVIGTQLLVVLVMQITEFSYHEAVLITFAFLGITLLPAIYWFLFRGYIGRARANAASKNLEKLLAEQERMIPEFRKVAEKLGDPKARAEALDALKIIESRKLD